MGLQAYPCPWWGQTPPWFPSTWPCFPYSKLFHTAWFPPTCATILVHTPDSSLLHPHCPWLLALVYKLFVCVYMTHHEYWLVQLAPACICIPENLAPTALTVNLNAWLWSWTLAFIFLHSPLQRVLLVIEKDKDHQSCERGPQFARVSWMEIWASLSHAKFSCSINEVSHWCLHSQSIDKYSVYRCDISYWLGVKNFRDSNSGSSSIMIASGGGWIWSGLGWVGGFNIEHGTAGVWLRDCKGVVGWWKWCRLCQDLIWPKKFIGDFWKAGCTKELGLNIDSTADLDSGAGIIRNWQAPNISIGLQQCRAEVVGVAHWGRWWKLAHVMMQGHVQGDSDIWW